MGDFSNKGTTYSSVGSTVGIGAHTLGVIKFKPPGVSPTGENGYELGNPNPVCFIQGKVEIENGTFTVRAAQWEDFAAAEPDVAAGRAEAPISVTLVGEGLPTLTRSSPRSLVRKIAGSEHDIGTTSEAVVDIEFGSLGVRSNERNWT